MRAYKKQRISKIQADLEVASLRYVLLAGDSHAELIGTPILGSCLSVNAWIGGASAGGYVAEFVRLRFTSRAASAVFFIGSNDIACINKPLSSRSMKLFERNIAALIIRIQLHASRIYVSSLPPVHPNLIYPQFIEATPIYNTIQENIAEYMGCILLIHSTI